MRTWTPALIGLGLAAAVSATAEPIIMNDVTYDSWQAYTSSEEFRTLERRCGSRFSPDEVDLSRGAAADCAYTSTNPLAEYDPGAPFIIDVVFHVITTSGGTGNVTDALIHSQIDILNEDYQALAGTNGANGNDAAIEFRLATVDPDGDPTDGITRSANTTWYNDGGSYWNTLAWDPDRYVNVYTNSAGGYLGYVPQLPQGGIVGSNSDRIVVLWSSVGRNAPIGSPYNQGRTLTHEMGHYLGLWHPFDNGCDGFNCYTSGDYICDTNEVSSPTFGCPASRITCGEQAPKENYMEYSDDLCMELFTVEQVRRIRCTLQYWRPNLSSSPLVGVAENVAGTTNFLAQNEPNPFGAGTRIRFQLPSATPVSLRVMDVTGRTVRTLFTGPREAGSHTVSWDGRDEARNPVAAGVYFYRLQTDRGSETRRMVKLD
ncbi:T9SS type A sorting domain-containing protein [bacterium]|nr:T9SS type A sorting domain-containing protein [bacterium]